MIHDSAEWVIFPFGKYKGYSLAHIIRNDLGYCQWILGKEDYSPAWKEAVRLACNNEDIDHLSLTRKEGRKPVKGVVGKKNIVEIIEKNRTTAKLFMPYDKSLIAKFKATIDGRKWDGEEKCWEFPIVQLPRVVDLIKTFEIKVSPKIKKMYAKVLAEEKARREIREKEDTDFEIEGLKLDLYPFQKVGVEFATRTGGRCLIADQPGLGKTAQALAYAQINHLKTIIVCPLSVVINWTKEIKKFTGKGATVWTSKGVKGHLNHQFHVTNFDSVRKIFHILRDIDYDLLIVDEATFLKNRNTLRYKSILGSYRERRKYPGIKTKHAIFLTGTPVMSRPIEAFTLLNFLDKQRFNNFYHFTQRYGGWKGTPVRNLAELHDRTKDLVIRRKKSEVFDEFPEKQRNDLFVELEPSERRKYKELLDDLFGKWRFNGKPTISTMPALQIFLAHQKIPRLLEIIEEYLDNDRPILIFCCFIEPLTRLYKELGPEVAALYHGGMNTEERQKAVDDLAEGRKKVGLFSIKAAGMGIDGLQKAIDTVVFLDRDWVPATHEQAEDRTHRIGQKNAVQVYYMTIADTIDEYMSDILKEKQKIAAEIVDGEIIDAINNKSYFSDLIARMRQEADF